MSEILPEVMPAREIYYDYATKAFDTQMQQIDQLDVKASAAFAAASATLAIIAGLLALAAPSVNGVGHAVSVVVFIVGLSVYVATAAILLRAYRVREWEYGPEFDEVALETGQRDLDVIQAWMAKSFVHAVQHNKEDVDCKSQLINYGLIGLLAESVVLALAVGTILFVR